MSVKFALRIGKAPAASAQALAANSGHLKGGNGRVALLIHGLTGTPQEMRSIARSLNRAGYSVSTPRLANHGGSLAALKKTTWEECYASVRSEFIALDRGHPSEMIFVAGLSMGALLALLIADEFKERVAGVSCLSPTLFYDGWNVPWTRCLLPLGYYTPLKHFFYFKEDPPYGIKNEEIRQAVHRHYRGARLSDTENAVRYGYPYIPITLLHQLRRLVKHLTAILPRITAPVQLIQAADDDMTSVRNSEFIRDRIGSAVKEMVLLHDSYHVITADQERQTVMEKMDAFFSGVAARSGRA